MTNKYEKGWVCPHCKKTVTDFPAISRRDNVKEICSSCGTNEALIDFYTAQKGKKLNKDELQAVADLQMSVEAFNKPENVKILKDVTKFVKDGKKL